MGVEKNITMKQFNGTDYDTLYPKTNVEQVENLTPSSIGAVAKAGDTMTGQLNVPALRLNYNAALKIGKNIDFHYEGSINDYDGRLAYDSGALLFRKKGSDYKTILHTGNLLDLGSDLGVAQIATGSYVGTGTKGPNNKNSLTFSFNPKFVAIWEDGDVVANLYVFTVEKSTYSVVRSSGSITPTHCTFDGKTLLWWTGNGSTDTGSESIQANVSGVTYDYVAFG